MIGLDGYIFAADQLVEFVADFKGKPATVHSIASLEALRIELQALWSEVKKSYAFCVQSDVSDDERQLLQVKAKYKLSSDTYVTCLSEMIELTRKFTVIQEAKCPPPVSAKDAPGPEIHSPTVNQDAPCLKVPPCDTDVFHGDYLTWPSFRDLFTAVYIKHPKLCDVQKLFHLRSKTKGEASNIVCKFPLTAESFELAWSALKDRYENNRILVNSQLKTLFNLPFIAHESSKGIKDIQREINDCISTLKAHSIDTSNWDSILVYLCSSSLPEKTLSLWEQSIKDPRTIPSWSDMDSFLTNRYQVLETVSDIRYTSTSKPKTATKPPALQSTRPKVHQSYHLKAKQSACRLCNDNHSLRFCSKFLKMSVGDRIDAVNNLKYCRNCLATSHVEKECRSVHTCMHCKSRHHTLLHWLPSPSQPVVSKGQDSVQEVTPLSNSQNPNIQSTSSEATRLLSHFSSNNNRVILATALVNIEHQGNTFSLRALLDPGSEVTFISEEAQKRLRLPVQPIQAHISGMNAVVTATASKLCSLILKSRYIPAFTLAANAIVLKRLTGDLPSCSVSSSEISEPIDIQLADPKFHCSSKIDMVLGADIYPSLLRDGLKPNVFGSLVAQNTIFGWVLSGPLPTTTLKCFSTFLSYFSETSLDKQISQFWEVEEICSKPVSPEEEICERHFSETTYRNSEGRYVVKLPFRDVSSPLGASRDAVKRQFLRTENSLSKTPNFQIEYNKVIEEYFTLHQMKIVDPIEVHRNKEIVSYYLPHHAVVKPESISTKIRVVFNASHPTSNGVSLNDALYVGPSLQSDLMSLILNWRFYKYVFNADIEKMYRQILIHPEHTPFQRILFRKSTQESIQDYELQTVTFGVNCAPYLAIRTLLQLADDIKTQFPLASNILQNEFYVDDVLSGAHDVQTAKLSQRELVAALSSAGFVLKKWTSNCPSLLDHFSPGDLLNQHFLKLEEKSCIKMLGIQWNAKSDCFEFSLLPSSVNTDILPITKRDALSVIARLFDPAGWLAPVIITSKIIMQQIWRDGTSWDLPLKPLTCHNWKNFIANLPDIRYIQIPRWIQFKPSVSIQIHGFCDASERAYAAALYLRVRHSDGSFTSHLLCAKTKVAPVKQITLPRLELCAALLLSRLYKKIVPNLKYAVDEVFLWTDSSIVIAWLKKPPQTWKTFVANRVSEISDNVDNRVWNHVASAENPADLATRGLTPLELRETHLWWHGPKWLSQSQDRWPASNSENPNEDDLEVRPIQSFATTECPNIELVINRFSSWARMIRVMSYVFRFVRRTCSQFQSPFDFTGTSLSQNEILFTRTQLIRLTQKLYFPDEYLALSRNQPISRKSILLTLNPSLDSNQLLRVNGRLACASLSYNEKYPIILPYGAHITALFTNFVHQISIHGGNELVIRLIRSEFWIPRIKSLVKKLIRLCKVCIIYKRKINTQIMAALPKERTVLSTPFTNTGIDYAGPFTIKSFAGRNCRMSKGYVCLFICFATKAIHLEAASDLSASAFLAAFARFVSRRGLPNTVFSDNGTNFVSASKALVNDFKLFIKSFSNHVSDTYQCQGLTWKFIPPGAPHMGGLWEAGVKSFKTHFRKIAADHKFTFEEFTTLLARVEACLNSRPISPISDNPSEIPPLTPGHFLRGAPLLATPEPDMASSSINIINRWDRLKILHHRFCLRWKEEYLKELHKRYKWKYPQRDISLNDLVVIREENLPPNEWRLGRVIKLHPGSDGRVRVAGIQTQNGVLTRPIVKLCVLTQS